MADESSDGIADMLLTLQDNDEDLLPKLTLYTGERLSPDPKPPINLHLSLGGAYTENSETIPNVQESAAVDNMASFYFADNTSMLKRSYLEQHKMAHKDEEIILIDNIVPGNTTGNARGNARSNTRGNTRGNARGKKKSKKKDNAPDILWASQSASQNPALLRALQIIKSESSQQPAAPRNKAGHNKGVGLQSDYQCDTHGMPHGTQGDTVQPFVFQELESGNSINPDDFLSLSPSNSTVDVDIGLSLPSNQDPSKETSAGSSLIPPKFVAVPTVPTVPPTANDKGKSVMIVEPPESGKNLSTPITYYGTSSNPGPAALATEISSSAYKPQGTIKSGNISATPSYFPSCYPAIMPMANPVPPFVASSSGNECGISNPMHCDPSYIAAAANANSQPAALAFVPNQWSNASIPVAVPVSGFPSGGSSSGNPVVIAPLAARGHPLMKRNGYLPDSQIEMIRHMPTVATDGGIPDGRKIEGFLYQYSKFEEVIIVCFCHGCFFSPKEFVMHAGGGEVENPMRLITIVPED